MSEWVLSRLQPGFSWFADKRNCRMLYQIIVQQSQVTSWLQESWLTDNRRRSQWWRRSSVISDAKERLFPIVCQRVAGPQPPIDPPARSVLFRRGTLSTQPFPFEACPTALISEFWATTATSRDQRARFYSSKMKKRSFGASCVLSGKPPAFRV